jgi:hypothetical protein
MSTPGSLKDLLVTILNLKKELRKSDMEKVKVAQETYHKLLDGFYEEYLDMMARINTKRQRMNRTIFLC